MSVCLLSICLSAILSLTWNPERNKSNTEDMNLHKFCSVFRLSLYFRVFCFSSKTSAIFEFVRSMPIAVKIKWGKQKWEGTLDPEKPPSVLKEAIYQKTGVPVERQKVMAPKGWSGTLKDVWKWKKGSCQMKDGDKVNVVGTSAGIPQAPKEKVVFTEDMTAEDKAAAGAANPPGLVNLGNTCYMNATVQALGSVPELRKYLAELSNGSNNQSGSTVLPCLLGQVFQKMQKTTDPIKLEISQFWMGLLQIFPQFGERGPNGIPKQQDAEEFLSNLFSTFKDVPVPEELLNGGGTSATSRSTESENLASALFGLKMETTLTCQEAQEIPSIKSEKTFKLVCNIDGGGGADQHINHIKAGLMLGLEGQLEKRSETLGRNALYKRAQRIDRLPRYICVQFMRFYWKATPDSRDHEGVRCKILRRVKFDQQLDIFEFCSDRLKAELKVQRDIDAAEIYASDQAKDEERAKEAAMATKKQKNGGSGKGKPVPYSGPNAKTKKMLKKVKALNSDANEEQTKKKSKQEHEQSEEDKALQEAIRMSTAGLIEESENEKEAGAHKSSRKVAHGADMGYGIPDNFRGLYEVSQFLQVVCHLDRVSLSWGQCCLFSDKIFVLRFVLATCDRNSCRSFCRWWSLSRVDTCSECSS